MDPPQGRKKREASLKRKEKGHAYSAKHARLQVKNAPKGLRVSSDMGKSKER